MNARARLEQARLYCCVGIREDLEDFLNAILANGVDVVQLRDKGASDDELRSAAKLFRDAADRHGALFVLNDRPDLAREGGADGVHLGQEDGDAAEARAVLGDVALIGRSTHAPDEFARAETEPVDYYGVGPVNATPTKPGRPGVGLAYVRVAAERATRPWFVTGGVDERTIPDMAEAGARRFVVVRALTEAVDPAAVARAIRRAIDAGPAVARRSDRTG